MDWKDDTDLEARFFAEGVEMDEQAAAEIEMSIDSDESDQTDSWVRRALGVLSLVPARE